MDIRISAAPRSNRNFAIYIRTFIRNIVTHVYIRNVAAHMSIINVATYNQRSIRNVAAYNQKSIRNVVAHMSLEILRHIIRSLLERFAAHTSIRNVAT